MISGFIGGHVRRANRNLFITNTIILGIVVLCGLAARKMFHNFLAGPREITPTEAAVLQDPDSVDRYFVKMTLDPRRYARNYMELSGRKQPDNGFYYYYRAGALPLWSERGPKSRPAPLKPRWKRPARASWTMC